MATNKSYLNGFAKTNSAIGRKLRFITKNKSINKDDFIEQLMITLIEADIGYKTSELICDKVYKKCKDSFFMLKSQQILDIVSDVLKEVYLEDEINPIVYNCDGPTVIFLVGVNGSGKTSACSKLAKMFLNQGKKVAVAAADTFRAGAIQQLQSWAEKIDIPCISGKQGQDPSSVLVDGCIYANNNNIDILLCDTAGRLQNKINLMNELDKMKRVCEKQIPGAPHDYWLVVDANTGQNGLNQALIFNEITDLNGVILTKIDGTSKGGIIIAIKHIVNVPVRYITFGESINDVSEFDIDLYIDSITKELEDVS